MIHVQYIKYGILSGLLLICMIMSSVTADSQNSVFAQITPAPKKLDSNSVATDSSHDTGAGDDNSQGITPSEKINGTTEEESTDSTDSNDANSGPTTAEQDGDETITSEEKDPDPTDQLVEAIMNEVMNETITSEEKDPDPTDQLVEAIMNEVTR
jgi:hypothetical protein